MRRLFYLILLLAIPLILITIGCQNDVYSEKLALAEHYIEENPDSSLSILNHIPAQNITKSNQIAHYGLLLTMAKDKCDEDISRDTLIIYANNYYSKHDDKHNEMLAKYFLSRVKYEQGNFPQSIILALQALELATQQNNPKYKSMASRTIADSYSQTYNYSDAVKYAIMEYQYVKDVNLQPYLNYALYDMASAMIADNRIKEGISFLCQARDSATLYNDSYLYNETERLMARALFQDGNYNKAREIWENIVNSGNGTRQDSSLLGTCFIKCGLPEKARSLMVNQNYTYSLNDALLNYEINKADNNTSLALEGLKQAYEITNEIVEQKMSTSISGLITDFFSNATRIEQAKHAETRFKSYLIITVLSCLIILGIISLVIINKERRTEIDRNVSFAMEMKQKMMNLQHDRKNTVRLLMSSRYTLLNRLCQTVFEGTSEANIHKRISMTVSDLIKEFSTTEKISELEQYVNEYHDNIMARFKDETKNVKNMQNIDYALFLLSILRFSTSSIALLLHEKKVTSIYDRKRRLRDKIKEANCESQQEFLEILGQRK